MQKTCEECARVKRANRILCQRMFTERKEKDNDKQEGKESQQQVSLLYHAGISEECHQHQTKYTPNNRSHAVEGSHVCPLLLRYLVWDERRYICEHGIDSNLLQDFSYKQERNV